MDIKQLKRENQELRELVNKLKKNRERIAMEIPEYDDYNSFLKGFDYVLDEIKIILNK
jgi:hypothetical protein